MAITVHAVLRKYDVAIYHAFLFKHDMDGEWMLSLGFVDRNGSRGAASKVIVDVPIDAGISMLKSYNKTDSFELNLLGTVYGRLVDFGSVIENTISRERDGE